VLRKRWENVCTVHCAFVQLWHSYGRAHPSRPVLGPTQPHMQLVLGLSREVSGRGVALTTHPHLGPRLKKEYKYTSTPLRAFVPCSRVNLFIRKRQCKRHAMKHASSSNVIGVVTIVHMLVTIVHMLVTIVHMLVTRVHMLVTTVHMLVTIVHMLVTIVHMLVTRVHMLVTIVHMLVTIVHMLVTIVHILVTIVHILVTIVHMLVTIVHMLVTIVHMLVTNPPR